MSTAPPPPRIFGLFARDAPVGVLFRRGPTKQVQLIKWNTADDTFEFGQWLKGRIYERRGDLSPDGQYLVYFAGNFNLSGPRTWTAISKPPFLTALAFWPKGDAWDGGGLFVANGKIVINGPHGCMRLFRPNQDPRILAGCPFKIETPGNNRGEDGPIEQDRMLRDGWHMKRELKVKRKGLWSGFETVQPQILCRSANGVELERALSYRVYDDIYRFSVRTGGREFELPETLWADFDQRSRICYSWNGAVYAIEPGQTLDDAKMLIDLTPNVFEPVAPPDWAKQW